MKNNCIRYINNIRDGYHHSSKYWLNIRDNLPELPKRLFEIAFAMILSDGTLGFKGKNAFMKIEQGAKQKEFVYHLFDIFKLYCFSVNPQAYIPKKGNLNIIKSYWFRTFSHKSFTDLWNIFYIEGRKSIKPGIITKYLTDEGLAFWIMSDGSLQKDKKSLILHTQSFDKEENEILSKELNNKFNLSSKVIKHKDIYYVIFIPSKDHKVIHNLIKPFIIKSFYYKLPILFDKNNTPHFKY